MKKITCWMFEILPFSSLFFFRVYLIVLIWITNTIKLTPFLTLSLNFRLYIEAIKAPFYVKTKAKLFRSAFRNEKPGVFCIKNSFSAADNFHFNLVGIVGRLRPFFHFIAVVEFFKRNQIRSFSFSWHYLPFRFSVLTGETALKLFC